MIQRSVRERDLITDRIPIDFVNQSASRSPGHVALLQQFRRDVMQPGCEPQLLVPACGLPYTIQSGRHARPSRSPGRGLPSRVSLGRTPSLHPLRRLIVFVRVLHRYYGSVRLPTIVPAGIAARLHRPVRPLSLTDHRGFSRFSSLERPRSLGFQWLRRASPPLALCAGAVWTTHRAITPSHGNCFFRSSIARLTLPLSTLRQPVTRTRRMTRGRGGWLALPRMVLSPTTPCRFIPTLSARATAGSRSFVLEWGQHFWG